MFPMKVERFENGERCHLYLLELLDCSPVNIKKEIADIK